MKNFEVWLVANEKQLDQVAVRLFSDSIKCFKHDIDRPAYLLAYQGLMRHLRSVILTGKRPKGFMEGEWDNYLAGLRHDHLWDENTYDRVVQKPKNDKIDPTKNRPAILSMSDEVRKKFSFFRDMRNICAHYKEYRFIKAHTLVLYSFIEQYLLTLTIEGGVASLVNDFRDFFDPSLTSLDEDIQPLINKLPSMIASEDMTDFINSVRKHVGRSLRYNLIELLHEMIMTLPDAYKHKIRQYIHDDEEILERYIDKYPDSVLVLLTDKSEIRKYWYDRLCYSSRPLEVVAQLLMSDKIQEGDCEEAFGRILAHYYRYGHGFYNVPDNVVNVLRGFGFFKLFMKNYYNAEYTRNHYQEICYKTDFYISIIELIEVDDTFVKNTCEIFDGQYPYTLKNRFVEEILKNAESTFQTRFYRIISDQGFHLPQSLK